MRKPDFFIVGAPKSGTTAMYFYLKQHPEIFMPERKELHFFGSDFFAPHFVRDLKDYLKFFEGADNKKRIGEASPWYLYSKRAAFEIKEFNPDADIIIMLRNPVDMMYSLRETLRKKGIERASFFSWQKCAKEHLKVFEKVLRK
jgi:hypothetical protein